MSLIMLLGAVVYGISVVLKNDNELSYLSYTTLLVVLNTLVSLLIGSVLLPPFLPEVKKSKRMFVNKFK